ncbi:Glycos_transf_1 domain-containing protein [Durusdinium trenchii]|uniref:Glycos_transf_1 domain-containing protein n=1 Tax=Durusdinium trenchii TaxID=1381693 RepID=A0ABP0QL03_9DINO
MKTFRSKLWPVLGFLVVVSLWVIVSQGRMLFGCETDTAAAATAPTGRSQILHSVGLPDKTCLFTISAFNNYGFVKSFLSRVEALHPDITCLIWVVADNRQVWGAQADKSLPSKILDDLPKRWHSVMVEELQPHMNFSFLELAFRYDLQCFNTAIKPAAFKFIFDRYKPSKILYFDNDIWIMQPLTAIMDALEEYSLVITPHATQPFPIDGKQQDERQIILAGQFNFGFVGLAATATTFQWLDFWGERLRYYGFAIPSEGMHFDQNWGDTILSYFPQEKYFILRDPRYNIAYWNLQYRGKHLHMVKDKVMYGSEPVVFMHFSGMSNLLNYNIETISQHQTRYKMSNFPKLRPIFEKYLAMLKAEDAMRWRHVPYGFGCFTDGTMIPDAVRTYYARMLDPGSSRRDDAVAFREFVAYHDPFKVDVGSKVSVLSWMLQGAHHLIVEPRGSDWVPEVAWQIYMSRPDVQSAFSDPFGKHREDLHGWFRSDGMRDHGLEPLKAHIIHVEQQQNSVVFQKRLPFGVNVYGWLNGVFGVGEASRLTLEALDEVGTPTAPILLPSNEQHEQRVTFVKPTRLPAYHFNLFVANALNTDEIRQKYPPGEWKRHYNIGYWAWELEVFPTPWLRNMEIFDEIWTVSDFVTNSILSAPGYAGKFSQPVTTMPMGLDMNLSMYRPNRELFDFPEGTMVFLVMFDFLSSFHRKNPLSALAAFKKAFELKPKAKVLLVIKCLLPTGHFAFEQEFWQLKDEVSKVSRVRIMIDVLSREDLRTLMASVDVFVSMHRSEGYGLVLLEMLMLGKPVIATNYSGNMEFMSQLPKEFRFMQVPFTYTWVNVSEPFKGIYKSDQRWADPDVSKAAKAMFLLYEDRTRLEACRSVVGPLFRKKFGAQSIGSRMQLHLKSLFSKPKHR